MAKNDSLATFKARGSAGPITYANWKGIGYFKQKAFVVANPKTDGQLNSRARLRSMVLLFGDFGNAVQIGFKKMAVKMSAYNAFVKENINTALTYVSLETYTVNYAALKVARGTLYPTAITTATASGASNNLTITYPTAVTSFNQSAGDLAMVAYYNINTGVVGFVSTNGATRADGTITVAVEGGVTSGDVIEAYLFFTTPDKSDASLSVNNQVTAGA